MKYNNKIPACFYHPITVMFIDDNNNFLSTLEMGLSSVNTLQMFTDLDKASEAIALNNQAFSQNLIKIIDKDEVTEASGHLVNIAINDIHRLIYDSSRFKDIGVVVVDYKMPQKNGVDFCASIDSPHIQKVLLTAQADQKVAINAFNAGCINQFMLKRSEDLNTLLMHAIEELKIQYFKRRSSVIFESLPIDTQDLLSSPVYQQIFESIQSDSDSVEYYMIDESGSFLFLDRRGEPTWFVVKKNRDIQAQYQLAEGLGVPDAILNLLRGYKNLIFMLSIEDERQPPEAWGDYVYPAQALGESHCYAIISNRTQNKLNWNDVCSYQV